MNLTIATDQAHALHTDYDNIYAQSLLPQAIDNTLRRLATEENIIACQEGTYICQRRDLMIDGI
jgi:hypothetical protein